MTKHRANFDCPAPLWDRVVEYSLRSGLHFSEIIRAALVEYLDRRAEKEKK